MALTFHRAKVAPGNFHKGRRWPEVDKAGKKIPAPIDQITIHVTEGSRDSVLEWFDDPKAEVSAHYMIAKDGMIFQFVDEEDEAFHNGRVDKPTAPLVLRRPGINPNYWSIGIEHEGDGTQDLTPEQRKASIALIRDICARRGIPMDRTHIVGHHEVYSIKPCPGRINVDILVSQAAGPGHPGSPDISIPKIVWSQFLNDYLVVVQVNSDTDWTYVPLKSLSSQAQKAGTRLSAMPLTVPIK